VLTAALEHTEGPLGSTARAWIRNCEKTIAGIDAALAVDNRPEIPAGTQVAPFHNGHKLPSAIDLGGGKDGKTE